MAGGAVPSRSKDQTIVAFPSCEAEYISLLTAALDSAWIFKKLCSRLGHASPTPICVMVNSQDSTSAAENMSTNARSNLIDICYHFVRKAVSLKQVTRTYGASYEQTADVLAKSLLRVLYGKMRNLLGIVI